jgi:hypothetical protein
MPSTSKAKFGTPLLTDAMERTPEAVETGNWMMAGVHVMARSAERKTSTPL